MWSYKQALAALLLLLTLIVAMEPPASGATRQNGAVVTTGHRDADVRRCVETKTLRTGGTSLRFPSCWTMRNYMEGSTMTNVIAFWSNQPMHQPCTTTRSGAKTTVRCGFPIRTLKSGGVLVEFLAGGMPGWTIANVVGQRLVVDHHAARETVVQAPYRSLHATDEYSIYIDRGIANNYYEFAVFFRSPGIAEHRRLLQEMLDSLRID
jgi:hypothetical protein